MSKAISTSPLSIVVPTLNEVGSVESLVARIDAAMHVAGRGYEIVVIDDHSSDGTRALLRKLSRDYPVSVTMKKGTPGKAQSLLEGFGRSQYPLIAMIDADLQYPPEALVDMLARLESEKADVVVTSRLINDTSFVRRFVSAGFRFAFVKLLFGLDFDTQSGLKLFKTAILDGLNLKSSPWSFDLDFIIRARQAGAVIVSQPIVFGVREHDAAKINVLRASFEIGKASLKLRYTLTREQVFGTKEMSA